MRVIMARHKSQGKKISNFKRLINFIRKKTLEESKIEEFSLSLSMITLPSVDIPPTTKILSITQTIVTTIPPKPTGKLSYSKPVLTNTLPDTLQQTFIPEPLKNTSKFLLSDFR